MCEDQRPEYLKIEAAFLSQRQRAISASCYTTERGFINIIACYPVSENSQKNVIYEVQENKAFALEDPFGDVVTLWR